MGQCSNLLKEGEQFRLNNYLGKWYEIARLNTIPFQKGDCGTAEYSLNEAGNIRVLNKEKTTEKDVSIVGEATKTDDPFRFEIAFGDTIISKIFKGDYRVIDTDYKNISVVYSCFDYFFGKFYYAWILARTPEIDEVLMENALMELETKYGITRGEMRFNDHSKTLCGDH